MLSGIESSPKNTFYLHRLDGEMDKKINYTIGWYLYWRTQMQWDSSRRLSSVGSRAHPCIKSVVPDYERKARGFDVPVMVIS